MFDQRVTLLSDYAGQYLQKGQESETGGLWNNMISLFGSRKSRPGISGFQGQLESADYLSDEGFAPFCKIDDRIIHVKKNQEECLIAISQNDKVWDLTTWGEDYMFATRFIAECYFMITRDDYHIDDDERTVFRAIIGCIEANSRGNSRCPQHRLLDSGGKSGRRRSGNGRRARGNGKDSPGT